MPQDDQNKQTQSDFLEETIKKRPVNRKKVFRRMVEVSMLAILFGAIACATIILLSPVLENMIFPQEEEETQAEIAEMDFAEEELEVVTEEISPEEMLTEEMLAEEAAQEAAEAEDAEPQAEFTVKNIVTDEAQFFSDLAVSCSKWLVTVRGVHSNLSWLESSLVSASESSGAIVTQSEDEVFVLTYSGSVLAADYIQVEFVDGTTAVGTIRGEDSNTGLVVLAVAKDDLSASTLESIASAVFYNSNLKSTLGSRVLAVGSPMGVFGSYVSGTVTAMGIEESAWDINYKIIMTDIYASESPQGFLVNLQGYIVGVLCNDYNSSDTKNILSVLGISELKKTIEKMYSGDELPRLGIQGTDVTTAANEEEGVPLGAYITSVKMDSAAMAAGIQVGDIVVGFDETEISGMSDLTSALLSHQVGDAVAVTICRLSQGEYREVEVSITLQ
ncbi:MAG: S1C family serine protease [Lachnospiraceae bacterium]|nr:S1C family serine protease [Lachnospiraceae bacterium]